MRPNELMHDWAARTNKRPRRLAGRTGAPRVVFALYATPSALSAAGRDHPRGATATKLVREAMAGGKVNFHNIFPGYSRAGGQDNA